MGKDPLAYQWLTYAWVIFISLWAGIANYFYRLKDAESKKFLLFELMSDITISGFVGMITFFFCESSALDPMLSAAIIGISAHMGSRGLFLIERVLVDVIKKRLHIED